MKKSKLLALVTGGALCLSLGITCFAGIPQGQNTTYALNNVEVVAMVDNVATETGLVYTAEDLKAVRDAWNDGSFTKDITLMADIDLGNEEWTPLGSSEHSFNKTFDGNNKTVSNLKVEESGEAGFFGWVASGTIKDLTLNNVNINGGDCVAALVAGGTIVNGQYWCTIENCHVTGNISVEGFYRVAGIAGGNCLGSIKSCSLNGNNGSYVKGLEEPVVDKYSGSDVGGIAAWLGNGGGTVDDCSVDNVDVLGTRRVGGIVGAMDSVNSHIKNCTFKNGMVVNTATADNETYLAEKDLVTTGGILGLCVGGGSEISGNKFENSILNTYKVKEYDNIDVEIVGSFYTDGDENSTNYSNNEVENALVGDHDNQYTEADLHTETDLPTSGDFDFWWIILVAAAFVVAGACIYVFVKKKKSDKEEK